MSYMSYMSVSADVSWCQLQHLGILTMPKAPVLSASSTLESGLARGTFPLPIRLKFVLLWCEWCEWYVILCTFSIVSFPRKTVNLHYIHLYSWSCHVGVHMLESCRPCLDSIEGMARNSGKQATPQKLKHLEEIKNLIKPMLFGSADGESWKWCICQYLSTLCMPVPSFAILFSF